MTAITPNSFSVGDIVIASMQDPHGQNRKPRTAMVIIVDESECVLIAITSSFHRHGPVPRTQIENLPWKPDLPKCRTGLDRPSRLDVAWFERVKEADCKKIGIMPVQLQLLAKNMYLKHLEELDKRNKS